MAYGRLSYRILFLLLYMFIYMQSVNAQPITTAENMALGGGGAAYLTGFESNFYNPANLMLGTSTYPYTIGIGPYSAQITPILNNNSPKARVEHLTSSFESNTSDYHYLTGAERETILQKHYKKTPFRRGFQHSSEWLIFGGKWQRGDKTFSMALRSRKATSFTIGRGWYDATFTEADSARKVIDRTLKQKFQLFHEISFGYAQSFALLSGLSPNLHQLYIGFAPKLLVGGSNMNINYDTFYEVDGSSRIRRISQFGYQSTAPFSEAIRSLRSDGNPYRAINQNISSTTLNQGTGYGLGLDFGIHYLIPLGSTVPDHLDINQRDRRKTIQIGVSVTDLGYFRYAARPMHLKSKMDTTYPSTSELPEEASAVYRGSPGQYLMYINNHAEANPFQTVNVDNSSYTRLLPTALHAGLKFQYRPFTVVGDLNVGITENAFHNTDLRFSTGTELRIIPQFPIRFGMRLQSNRGTRFGLGIGFESERWKIDIAGEFSTNDTNKRYELIGGSLINIRYYL